MSCRWIVSQRGLMQVIVDTTRQARNTVAFPVNRTAHGRSASCPGPASPQPRAAAAPECGSGPTGIVCCLWPAVVNSCSPNAPACRITSRLAWVQVDQLHRDLGGRDLVDQGRDVRRQAGAKALWVEVKESAVKQPAVINVIRRAQHQLHEPFEHDGIAILPVVNVALGRRAMVSLRINSIRRRVSAYVALRISNG